MKFINIRELSTGTSLLIITHLPHPKDLTTQISRPKSGEPTKKARSFWARLDLPCYAFSIMFTMAIAKNVFWTPFEGS
ncbi:MAG: hypothetical protein [Olavius algarvensis Gamma 1 endosymbiont]|nr:MAG: hypothetical protein [Olavius algarvensis Gamma 1 endosymbiont]